MRRIAFFKIKCKAKNWSKTFKIFKINKKYLGTRINYKLYRLQGYLSAIRMKSSTTKSQYKIQMNI